MSRTTSFLAIPLLPTTAAAALPVGVTLALTLAAVLAVALAATGARALTRWVGRDGYGGPPPAPTADWASRTLPSRPYARS